MPQSRLRPDGTADEASPRRLVPLAVAAGGVAVVLAGGLLWLALSGPLPNRGAAVALPRAPAVPVPQAAGASTPPERQEASAPAAPASAPTAAAAPPPAAPAGPAVAKAEPPQPEAPKPEPAQTAPAPAATAPAPVLAPDTAQSLLPPPLAQNAPAPPPGYSHGQALAPAPDVDLIEKVATGYLPVIGRDGRQPWQVYARPFDLADKRPRVALVISALGMSATQTDAAINHLPAGVTLAFQPYARKLGEWINLSRAAGHEVMLTLPMEPLDYPRNDPGPNGLLTALEPAKNMERFNWVLSQGTGYVGLVGYEGSRFTASHDDMMPVLEAVKRRGLLFVDNRETAQTAIPALAADIKLPFASSNRTIDRDATRAGVDKRLAELEDIARRNSAAVGIGSPFPVTFERIAVWAQGLEDRGVVLAPVSAVIGRTREQAPQKGEPGAAGKEGADKDAEGATAQQPTAPKDAALAKDASKNTTAAGAKTPAGGKQE